jgi:hypothetical protein
VLDLPPHAQELMLRDPRRLGSYAILARLGAGGQGVVYLGEQQDGRLVAIKMIRVRDRRHREQFAQEAEHARQMPHFCVAQVLDDTAVAGVANQPVSVYPRPWSCTRAAASRNCETGSAAYGKACLVHRRHQRTSGGV